MSAIGDFVGAVTAVRKTLRALEQEKLADAHRAAVESALSQLSEAQDRLADIQADSIAQGEENERLKRQIADADTWTERLSHYELVDTEGGAGL